MSGGWRLWVVTLGGLGRMPFAPGTWGSLFATVLHGALYYALTMGMGIHPTWAWNVPAAVTLVIYSILCVNLGPWTVNFFGKKDPGSCVVDEGAGICLTALMMPIYPMWRQLWTLAAVFLAFRLFDIIKLPPCNRLEKLPLGWGILMDDLMAAVYANVLCQFLLRALI